MEGLEPSPELPVRVGGMEPKETSQGDQTAGTTVRQPSLTLKIKRKEENLVLSSVDMDRGILSLFLRQETELCV